jgi:hypothetical protein
VISSQTSIVVVGLLQKVRNMDERGSIMIEKGTDSLFELWPKIFVMVFAIVVTICVLDATLPTDG